MRLLTVELTRLRWRRAILLVLVVSAVLPVLFFAGTAWDTRPYSDAEIAEAEAQVERDNQYHQESIDDCIARPREFGLEPTDDLEAICPEMVGTHDVTSYLYREPLSIPGALSDTGTAVAVFAVLLALLVGTTFAGADWASGSMSNQLLFESRRSRIWLAKAGAVLIAGLVLAVVALVIFWALIATLAAYRDIDTTGDQWRDVLGQVARVTPFAGLAAVAAFALTMLFRSTVATLGLMLALAVGGTMLVAVLPVASPEEWMLHANALAILQDGYTYYTSGYQVCTEFECTGGEKTLSAGRGAAYFGVLLVLVSALSVASFRRRDVP